MDIHIGRYTARPPEAQPGVNYPIDWFEGWIEPDNKKWVLFLTTEGDPVLFTNRDPDTGAVLD